MQPMLKIDDELYYDEEALRIQGLDGDALKQARDSGQLAFKRVGRRVVYKGEWLREWLDRPEKAVRTA